MHYHLWKHCPPSGESGRLSAALEKDIVAFPSDGPFDFPAGTRGVILACGRPVETYDGRVEETPSRHVDGVLDMAAKAYRLGKVDWPGDYWPDWTTSLSARNRRRGGRGRLGFWWRTKKEGDLRDGGTQLSITGVGCPVVHHGRDDGQRRPSDG